MGSSQKCLTLVGKKKRFFKKRRHTVVPQRALDFFQGRATLISARDSISVGSVNNLENIVVLTRKIFFNIFWTFFCDTRFSTSAAYCSATLMSCQFWRQSNPFGESTISTLYMYTTANSRGFLMFIDFPKIIKMCEFGNLSSGALVGNIRPIKINLSWMGRWTFFRTARLLLNCTK